MPIRATYNMTQIRQELSQFAENIESYLLLTLKQVGLTFVRDARNMTKEKGGFDDDTGNLRSSIGYFILKDGVIVSENFKQYKQGFEGKIMAERILNDVRGKSGYQLVGVAGMDYASHVESKGFNVITVQGDMMLVNLDSYLKSLEKKYNKK